MNPLSIEKLQEVYNQDPPPTAIFDWNAFTNDPFSRIIEERISVQKIGDLFTSMTFPLHSPGQIKNVKGKGVWKGPELEKKQSILQGLKEGTLKRELILASFREGSLFLLDGQKRARVIFEAIRDSIPIQYTSYPVFVLENPQMYRFSEDLSLLNIS